MRNNDKFKKSKNNEKSKSSRIGTRFKITQHFHFGVESTQSNQQLIQFNSLTSAFFGGYLNVIYPIRMLFIYALCS